MQAELLRILIVDDNPADRHLYKLSLRDGSNGIFECADAEDGEKGLHACKETSPDCIVLDFNLPDMDGLQFISVLRKQNGDLPCAVVMLTGIQDERVAVRAMKSGVTDYVPKTSHAHEGLPSTIIGAVERFRMRREIAEQRLAIAARERQYSALMEAIPQLVWVSDEKGVIEYANRRWSEYTGLGPAEHVLLDHAVLAEDRDRFRDIWQRAVQANDPFEMELRLQRAADGSSRWHLIRVVAMHDAALHSGNERKWLGTGTDIEDRKRAESALQQKQKWESIGLLAGGIAHDFNNLLTGILGGASYVSECLRPGDSLQSTLGVILKSGERAAQLTRQMLDYSGKGRFVIEQVDLSAAVRETCELIRASIPANVRITLDMASSLPTIEADAGQIQQVVMNLVINGAESIPREQQGNVSVRTLARDFQADSLPPNCLGPHDVAAGRYVVLEVEDTGAGMDEATKGKIFDPFFTTKFTGRGLGLAAVEGILRAARGCVAVESAPGKGSTFRIFIPASTHAAAYSVRTTTGSKRIGETVGAPGSARTVLIIDDEEVVRNVTRAALERAGYAVVTADGGEAGIRILEQQQGKISLVLLDMCMPGMSGKEFLENVHALAIDVPIAICSGYSEQEVQRQLKGCQFAAFVQKPFDIGQLQARVDSMLKTTKAANR